MIVIGVDSGKPSAAADLWVLGLVLARAQRQKERTCPVILKPERISVRLAVAQRRETRLLVPFRVLKLTGCGKV